MKAKKIFVALAGLILTGSLTACTVSAPRFYSDADKYYVGDTIIKDGVDTIEIEWTSGEVNFTTTQSDAINVVETGAESLKDEERMHWFLDGTTLRIKFCESGLGIVLPSNVKKILNVTVPDDIDLSQVSILTTSADITANDIKVNSLKADSTSGDIELACEANIIEADSTSGNVILVQKGSSELIDICSTSGNMNAEFEKAMELKADSTSGKITLTGEVSDNVAIDSTSGSVCFDMLTTPKNVSVETTSSDIKLLLPEDSDFKATFDGTSGKLSTDFSCKMSDDTYTCGEGIATININTTSGDAEIIKR